MDGQVKVHDREERVIIIEELLLEKITEALIKWQPDKMHFREYLNMSLKDLQALYCREIGLPPLSRSKDKKLAGLQIINIVKIEDMQTEPHYIPSTFSLTDWMHSLKADEAKILERLKTIGVPLTSTGKNLGLKPLWSKYFNDMPRTAFIDAYTSLKESYSQIAI